MLHSAPCFILVDVCRFDAYTGINDVAIIGVQHIGRHSIRTFVKTRWLSA